MNERLKQLRKALKLNQVDFGAKLSLTGSAISRYESGVNAMADNIVLLICREFDVNEEWLRYGTGSMFSQKNMDLIEQLSDSMAASFWKPIWNCLILINGLWNALWPI